MLLQGNRAMHCTNLPPGSEDAWLIFKNFNTIWSDGWTDSWTKHSIMALSVERRAVKTDNSTYSTNINDLGLQY